MLHIVMQQHVCNIKINRSDIVKYIIWSIPQKESKICLNGLNNIFDDIVFDLFKITDMLPHNYVQHEKCLPSVTKNYELYYSLKMVK